MLCTITLPPPTKLIVLVYAVQVSLLFEVGSLAVASPATVSRCGMVYYDYADLGWQPFVDSWLESKSDKVASSTQTPAAHACALHVFCIMVVLLVYIDVLCT